MQAYSYDETTYYYKGEQTCQLDPLESKIQGKEIYLLPGNCTWKKPLKEKEGYKIKFNGTKWEYEKEEEKKEEKPYIPTQEEKEQNIRNIRNYYLESIQWRIDRYKEQLEIGITPEDNEKIYTQLLLYKQYLRDYPASSEDWFEYEPKKFEEWSK